MYNLDIYFPMRVEKINLKGELGDFWLVLPVFFACLTSTFKALSPKFVTF